MAIVEVIHNFALVHSYDIGSCSQIIEEKFPKEDDPLNLVLGVETFKGSLKLEFLEGLIARVVAAEFVILQA